jgi:ADP-ribose pyrophosphatase YjhB (NUDIX family)
MKKFNIRVYGIIINEESEILVSDECRFSESFTKFPGGGVQWGEGLKECLKRELKEELGMECEIGALFYVNDFFQQSAFRSEDQLISFYFLVDSIDTATINVSVGSDNSTNSEEVFRWVPLERITPELMTFPIDKHVAGMLKDHGSE